MRHALFVSVAALALAPVAHAIYGGEPAEEGAYPFMVHLFIDEPHEGIVCGGFLVTPTVVVTAGHCVPSIADDTLGPNPVSGGERLEDYRALLGRANLTGEGGEIIAIAEAHRHPEYTQVAFPAGAVRPMNDIAVLILAEPSTYAPVRIAGAEDIGLYPHGSMARVIGWGCTPDVCFPTELMEVDVPVVSDELCGAAPNYRVQFHPATEVCAGSDGKDSCGGDSGGPLFIDDGVGPLVIGIVSYGALLEVNADDPEAGLAPCGSAQHPGVYAEVAAFEQFLAPFL